MIDQNTTDDKADGCTAVDKSAVVAVPIGPGPMILAAEHVITTSNKTIVYLGEKSDGIDIIVGQAGSVVCRSDEAHKLLSEHLTGDSDIDTDVHEDTLTDGEKRVMTDGGREDMDLPDYPSCRLKHCTDENPCTDCRLDWYDTVFYDVLDMGIGSMVEFESETYEVLVKRVGPQIALGQEVDMGDRSMKERYPVMPVRDESMFDVTVIEEVSE